MTVVSQVVEMKPWRPDQVQTRVALQDIVETYFDDMGYTGAVRQAKYAELAARLEEKFGTKAAQLKERAHGTAIRKGN
jgi:hypothetical protein